MERAVKTPRCAVKTPRGAVYATELGGQIWRTTGKNIIEQMIMEDVNPIAGSISHSPVKSEFLEHGGYEPEHSGILACILACGRLWIRTELSSANVYSILTHVR